MMSASETDKAVGIPRRPVVLISGVAEGLGASLAGTFASAGYDVIGLARSERMRPHLLATVAEAGGAYRHIACDVASSADLATELAPIAQDIEVVVHNAHHFVMGPFDETAPADFELAWRVACLGAASVARIVLPYMTSRGDGTIIFTGATASVRGGARFSAFASAKFALRGFSQALAREYGPKGVHIAHVVVDGLIWGPRTGQRWSAERSACLEPDAVAATYLGLVRQHCSAWTHELDLRPYSERF